MSTSFAPSPGSSANKLLSESSRLDTRRAQLDALGLTAPMKTPTLQEIARSCIALMSNGNVTIYTDGACSGNPGPGGWAAAIVCDGQIRDISGGFAKTTNNRMELYAVIASLEDLDDAVEDVTVCSDSKYVVDMINNGHAQRWSQNGWMRDKIHMALNSDLWDRLLTLCLERDIQFVWVKGHSGNEINERVDQLAVAACAIKDAPEDEGFATPPLFPSDGLFVQQDLF
jgi:ribonuclease HI